jgi:hypothetical protein
MAETTACSCHLHEADSIAGDTFRCKRHLASAAKSRGHWAARSRMKDHLCGCTQEASETPTEVAAKKAGSVSTVLPGWPVQLET